MKVMVRVFWEDQSKVPIMAAKVAPIFANPPKGIKRIASYGIIGGNSVYSVYEVEDEAVLVKYATAICMAGFSTEISPAIETETGIKAMLEAAKLLEAK